MAAHNAEILNDQLPLKHVVLCSTSLSQDDRTRLAKLATEMGAAHRLDLTGDVTHLLVGDTNTVKYWYVAKQRPDIKVLHPSWVEAIQQIWTNAEDVDLDALDKEHRLPPLCGLKISVTGFIDTEERTHIAELVKENGAAYHGDLTKQVTHLIVAKPEGAKYAAAKAWGVATVSVKWLNDSLTRGMALDVGLYDPKTPEEEQGVGAFVTVKPRMSVLKRARDSESHDNGHSGPRKLRRSASSRLQSHSQNVWQDMAVEDSMIQPQDQSGFSLGDDDSQQTLDVDAPAPTESRPASFSAAYPTQVVQRPQGFFAGLHIYLHDFGTAQRQRLVSCLTGNGAVILVDKDEISDAKDRPHYRLTCVLVPNELVERPSFLDNVPKDAVIATEWWVERCMRSKQLLNPKSDVLSQPRWNLLVDGMAGMSICSSGFDSVDLRHVAKTVQANDATYVQQLAAGITVLISGSGAMNVEKAKYAARKGVPVVTAAWLWDSFLQERIVDIEAYRIAAPALDPHESAAGSAASSPAPTGTNNQRGRTKTSKDPPVRLSNTRKRHATPSLQLYASRPPPSTSKKAVGPFVHEDDDLPIAIDAPCMPHVSREQPSQSRSQALQDISPNASPRKQDRDQEVVHIDDDDDDVDPPKKAPASPPTSNTSQHPPSPAKPPEPEYTADLQAIIEQRRAASRPGTSSSVQQPLQRLKARRLGRASSGSSLNPRSLSSTSIDQATSALSKAPDLDSRFTDGFDDTAPTHSAPEPPRTQLGYDTPEAAAERLQKEKRMGASFSDTPMGNRVASLGTVKDSGGTGVGSRAAGAAGRAKGRTRR